MQWFDFAVNCSRKLYVQLSYSLSQKVILMVQNLAEKQRVMG